MNAKNITNEIDRLKFEDILWIIFAILCIANVYGDYNEIEYLETNNQTFETKANLVFEITLIITLLIYIYFFIRNYKAYEQSLPEEKSIYTIKLLGSSLLIAGVLCLLYFQTKQTSFTGAPAL